MNTAGGKDLALAGLIHDLNNVFQTLVEVADLLSTDPKWVGLSNTILRSVETGKHITGSLDDSIRSTPLDAILDRAIQFTEDLQGTSSSTGVTVRRYVQPGLRFRGRAMAMERVLMNLLVNGVRAVQATGKAGELVVEAAGEPEPDKGIRITVSDSGNGIDPAILDRIFEPGFSTRSESSGLGLHIVRSIVEEHGGSVAAANREGANHGACFTIRIPGRPAGKPKTTGEAQ